MSVKAISVEAISVEAISVEAISVETTSVKAISVKSISVKTLGLASSGFFSPEDSNPKSWTCRPRQIAMTVGHLSAKHWPTCSGAAIFAVISGLG